MKISKGSLLFNEYTKLDNGLIKPKYFVVMEELTGNTQSRVIFLTTSKKGDPKRVVKFEEPNGKVAYLILPKFYDIKIWKLKLYYKNVGLLEQGEIEKLEGFIKSSTLVPEKVKNRVLCKIKFQSNKTKDNQTKLNKKKKNKAAKFEFVSKEMIDEIKRKLGFYT